MTVSTSNEMERSLESITTFAGSESNPLLARIQSLLKSTVDLEAWNTDYYVLPDFFGETILYGDFSISGNKWHGYIKIDADQNKQRLRVISELPLDTDLTDAALDRIEDACSYGNLWIEISGTNPHNFVFNFNRAENAVYFVGSAHSKEGADISDLSLLYTLTVHKMLLAHYHHHIEQELLERQSPEQAS